MIKNFDQLVQKKWCAFTMCALPFFILLFPFLIGSAVFVGLDTRQYPFYFFYNDSLTSGNSFLWNPLNYSGFPIFVSITGGFLFPIFFVLFKFLPYIEAYHWIVFLSLALSSYGTFIFLRKLNVHYLGCFMAAYVFGFSQWIWVGDVVIMVTMPLLPLSFLWILELSRGKNYPIFLLALGIAYGILAGMFNYLLETIFAVGLFAIFLFFYTWNSGQFFFCSKNIKTLYGSIIGVGGGIILSFYQIIPTLVYTPLSAGRGSIDHWGAVSGGIVWSDLFKLFSPYFDPWFLNGSYERFYIGIMPLILFFASFWFKKSGVIRFFYGLFFASVFLSLDGSWLFWILHHVPPFNLLHLSFRWMFIGWFAAAVIVGWAVDRIMAGEEIRYVPKIAGFFGILFWGLFGASASVFTALFFFQERILGLLKNYFRDTMYAATSGGFSLEHYYNYIDRLFLQTKNLIDITNPMFFMPLIFVGVGWYVLSRFRDGTIDRLMFSRLIVIITVFNLSAVWFVYSRSIDAGVLKTKPAIAGFIETRGVDGRVLTFLRKYTEFEKLQIPAGGNEVSFTELSVLNREMLFANTNLLYGVESAEIYEPLMSRRMARVVALTGSNLVWFGSVLAAESGTPQDKAAKLETRKNILNFLNIRYIISAYPFDDSVFPKIFETTILPPYNIPIGVYENASARPRFYFASSLETILQASPSGNSLEDEIAAFEKLKTISEDGLSIFVECEVEKIPNSKLNPCENQIIVDGKGTIEAITKKNTISVLKTSSQTPQFLVFSENNLPGWKAYIDNRETPIYTTGSVYMGVAVPEGEHEVRFEFTYKTIIDEFLKRYW